MLLLSDNNRMLQEMVAAQVNWAAEEGDEAEERKSMSAKLCDFDGVFYSVDVAEENLNVVRVQMYIPSWDNMAERGGNKALQDIYGSFVSEPTDGNSFAIDIDISTLDTEEKKAKIIEDIGKLRTNAIGGFFHYFFDSLNEGKIEAPFRMQFGTDTQLYVVPAKDRIVFIYDLAFNDKADQAIARLVMREFNDAKKLKELQRAPPCNFSVKAPMELEQFKVTEPQGNIGFLSVAVLKEHVTDKKRRANAASMLQVLRSHVQYHLKCSKAYIHSRMRKRVKDLLKILSRAKQTAEEAAVSGRRVVKRTVDGKVFKGPAAAGKS